MVQRTVTRRLVWALLTFLGIMLAGGVGYHLIEGWPLLDSLYMAVITVTTVGYGEVRPMDAAGRAFTIALVLLGVGAFTYAGTTLANYFIAGELAGLLGQRRMERQIQQLKEHYIVCGFGRMGAEVATDFRRESKPLVVVDRRPEVVERAIAAGHLALCGEAGDDNVLRKAGIERAKGLITAIDDDAANLMVVLSARALNEKLFIVARANQQMTESKLVTAGANRVLSPYGIAGRRMVQMALRPNVVEFLEVVMHDEQLELWMEELTIALGSGLDGCAIGASRIREGTGAMIVALRQRTGAMVVAPTSQTVLNAGDILVAIGTREQVVKLGELSHHPVPAAARPVGS